MPDGIFGVEDFHKQRARFCVGCGNLQVFTELSKRQKQHLLNKTV